METVLDVTIYKGQIADLIFSVASAGGVPDAHWYLADGPNIPTVEQRLILTTPVITLEEVGIDEVITVPLNSVQTESLPAGRLFHQLWVTDSSGFPVPVAEGVLIVKNSLRQ